MTGTKQILRFAQNDIAEKFFLGVLGVLAAKSSLIKKGSTKNVFVLLELCGRQMTSALGNNAIRKSFLWEALH